MALSHNQLSRPSPLPTRPIDQPRDSVPDWPLATVGRVRRLACGAVRGTERNIQIVVILVHPPVSVDWAACCHASNFQTENELGGRDLPTESMLAASDPFGRLMPCHGTDHVGLRFVHYSKPGGQSSTANPARIVSLIK